VEGLKNAAPRLAEQIFDSGVHHGIGDPGKWLQESLDETLGTDLQMKDKDGNASYDGVVGSQTRGAVERAVREGKIKEVNNRIVEKRIQYMRSLPVLVPT
jgi:lysozyme family protein